MIRYCAPAQWFARTVRKPFTVHDTTIRPGQRVITLLASANRDEREYPDPDAFIWNRPIERLLAFGRGQHFCLGVHLARLEIGILVNEWLDRVTEWRIDDTAASRPPSSFQWAGTVFPSRSRWRCEMWAYRLVAPYTLERADIVERTPESLGDRQVLLRFEVAGICGSDLPPFRGCAARFPAIGA